MKILKMLISFALISTVFCSCSKDEEYNPQLASAIFNSLYVSILDKRGNSMNNEAMLANNEFSVIEESNRKAKVDVTDYEGTKVFRFSVDLPDTRSMEYNKDKTEASGKVGMVMNIKGTTLPMIVNFSYVTSKEAMQMYGGSCIRIKSIMLIRRFILQKKWASILLR
ncbi:hypothetical protein [Segatella albensis]|uniref:hypothetical protein n=1 Tax=Segatella albensis TaxID=77768 RepID=UPI001EE28C64|nr:hypothetical protein [Segatella albensis]